MSNNDVASRVQGTEEDQEEGEEEGLYATYAMLHTIRKEWVIGGDRARARERLRLGLGKG